MRGQSQAQDVSGNQPSATVSSFQRTTLTKRQAASVSGTICSQARCSGTACLALFFFSGGDSGLLLVPARVEPDLEWKDGNGNDPAQVVTPALQGPTRVLPTPP